MSLSPPIKRDLYCWVCHLDAPLMKCKNCPRAYHRHCAYSMLNFPEPYYDPHSSTPDQMDECPECVVARRTALPNMKNVPSNELKAILTCVAKNLKDGYYWPNPYYKLETERRFKDLVAKIVDISKIENMAYEGQFNSLEGFLGEAKWMLHNSIINDGKSARDSENAKEVLRLCKLELMAVDLCPECYLREQDREKNPSWFVKPCLRQPHVVGWAKTPNSPYWPVKIMLIRGDQVTVRTFGDYRRFDIPTSDCFLFSRTPPKKNNGRRRDEFRKAMNELERHLDELRDIHSRVELADNIISLKGFTTLEALTRMFPEVNKPRIIDYDSDAAENAGNNNF